MYRGNTWNFFLVSTLLGAQKMEMGSPVNKERLEGLVESIFQNNATVYEANQLNPRKMQGCKG